jgi:hypothetical protein
VMMNRPITSTDAIDEMNSGIVSFGFSGSVAAGFTLFSVVCVVLAKLVPVDSSGWGCG